MKKVLLYLSAGFATLVFIFLLGNLQNGYKYKPSDELIQIVPFNPKNYVKASQFLEANPYDQKEQIIKVPKGQTERYINLLKGPYGPNIEAIPVIIPQKFNWNEYSNALENNLKGLLNGNYGELTSISGKEIAFSEGIKNMMQLTSTYFFPALFSAIVIGAGLAVAASLFRWFGRITDAIHRVLVAIPDFFLIVLLIYIVILLSKFTTKRLVLVTQIHTEIPFLIPYITITFIPALVIYGTMRIAIDRELRKVISKPLCQKGFQIAGF